MTKTILITGGCGFMGSHFVRRMVAQYPDYRIINFDKLTYAGRQENLSDIEGCAHYTFIQGDVATISDVEDALTGVDVVVHFACESHVDRSIKDASVFIKTNVTGTYNLVEAARQKGVTKFIQISTDEVYGSIDEGMFTEASALNPNNPYSASKAAADCWVRSYIKTYDFPAIIVRCCNNYGPNQNPEKFIPRMISCALENKKMPVYGDGTQIRDWIYVEDCAQAIDKVVHDGKAGEIYNIGANNEWQNIDVVKLIAEELKVNEDRIEFVKDRPGHDRRYAIDSSKIQNELGWKPEISFEDGIIRTIQWYRENGEWINSVRC